MLDVKTLDIADRRWAQDFDLGPATLRPTAPHVQEHAGRMQGAEGIWILWAGGAPLISLPESTWDVLTRRAITWDVELVSDPGALADALRPLVSPKIVGPAWIGYGTKETLDLSSAERARELNDSDADAVPALRADCSEEGWAHGGSEHGAVPTFGAFAEDGTLGALAGYRIWDERIAHLSIVGARRHGGQGHGTAAVARAARHALDAGLLPQYRTLANNAPSRGIARRLGFETYGYSVFVRLPGA